MIQIEQKTHKRRCTKTVSEREDLYEKMEMVRDCVGCCACDGGGSRRVVWKADENACGFAQKLPKRKFGAYVSAHPLNSADEKNQQGRGHVFVPKGGQLSVGKAVCFCGLFL